MADRYDSGARSAGRLGGAAREGADLIRRALGVAAREEVSQAREEAIERLTPVARSGAMMVGGGFLAACGAAYLLQAAVSALSTRMPRWVALLLTGAALTLGGAALLECGRRQLKDSEMLTHEEEQQP